MVAKPGIFGRLASSLGKHMINITVVAQVLLAVCTFCWVPWVCPREETCQNIGILKPWVQSV